MRALFPIVALAGLLANNRAMAEPKYPHLHYALYEMREARKELKDAKDDFGGHKEKGIKHLDDAIKQTEKALQSAADPLSNYAPAPGTYDKYSNYPHLRRALVEMAEAGKEMKTAKIEFGGRKEKTQKELEAAVKQVEKCIAHIP